MIAVVSFPPAVLYWFVIHPWAGFWRRLGPWTVQVTDGSIDLRARGGDANLSGIEVWRRTASSEDRRRGRASAALVMPALVVGLAFTFTRSAWVGACVAVGLYAVNR